ncbi:MAG: type II toxin-antitoxin system RelE/ParE family toxin [Pirellulaceae bacterium]
MNRLLDIQPRALIDVADIFEYFLAVDPRVAMRFYDAYDAALPLIERMPEAGGKLLLDGHEALDLRYVRPKGFEHYLIFYRLTATTIEVVRVLHSSRDLAAALVGP